MMPEQGNLMAEPETGPPNISWLIIFTDLVALLLTFFVLLFSMSTVKVDKWNAATDALSQSLNPSGAKPVTAATAQFNVGSIFRKRAINLDYLTSVLSETMAKDRFLAKVPLVRLEDRMIITLPGRLLFPDGGVTLAEEAREALFNLGGTLSQIGNKVAVNGYSDPGSPTGAFNSRWELSLARAISVANMLRQSGYTENITAFGYAESRYGFLSGLPEDQRRSLGRRVDIVISPVVGAADG